METTVGQNLRFFLCKEMKKWDKKNSFFYS